MTNEEIDTLWREAQNLGKDAAWDILVHFARLVAAAERETLQREGWRKCAEGQRTTQFCGMIQQAVLAEREACAKVCETLRPSQREFAPRYFDAAEDCAAAIRARGEA